MAITVKNRKLLWSKSANLCNICRKELCIESENDKHTIIGEECHIVAKSNNGPRGKDNLNKEERDKYDNLILLCGDHHTEIDDNEEKYTIKELKNLKAKHEKWVRKTLSSEQIEELEYYFDEEVVFDEDYLNEIVEWVMENTEYEEMKKKHIKQAINKLSYLDKKTRKLLLGILNYHKDNNEIDIRSIYNKLVNDDVFAHAEFFAGIRELDKHDFIDFDDTFQTIEVGDNTIILDGDSDSEYKYLFKSSWLDSYGIVLRVLQKYLDNKKLIKDLIVQLEYGII